MMPPSSGFPELSLISAYQGKPAIAEIAIVIPIVISDEEALFILS
jgi:hypothetical protein